MSQQRDIYLNINYDYGTYKYVYGNDAVRQEEDEVDEEYYEEDFDGTPERLSRNYMILTFRVTELQKACNTLSIANNKLFDRVDQLEQYLKYRTTKCSEDNDSEVKYSSYMSYSSDHYLYSHLEYVYNDLKDCMDGVETYRQKMQEYLTCKDEIIGELVEKYDQLENDFTGLYEDYTEVISRNYTLQAELNSSRNKVYDEESIEQLGLYSYNQLSCPSSSDFDTSVRNYLYKLIYKLVAELNYERACRKRSKYYIKKLYDYNKVLYEQIKSRNRKIMIYYMYALKNKRSYNNYYVDTDTLYWERYRATKRYRPSQLSSYYRKRGTLYTDRVVCNDGLTYRGHYNWHQIAKIISESRQNAQSLPRYSMSRQNDSKSYLYLKELKRQTGKTGHSRLYNSPSHYKIPVHNNLAASADLYGIPPSVNTHTYTGQVTHKKYPNEQPIKMTAIPWTKKDQPIIYTLKFSQQNGNEPLTPTVNHPIKLYSRVTSPYRTTTTDRLTISDRNKYKLSSNYSSSQANLRTMVSFTISELLTNRVDISAKYKLIIVKKFLDHYIKKINSKNYATGKIDSIIISNFSHINPNLLIVRSQAGESTEEDTEEKLVQHLAKLLDCVLNQTQYRNGEVRSEIEWEVVTRIGKISSMSVAEIDYLQSLRKLVDEAIKLRSK